MNNICRRKNSHKLINNILDRRKYRDGFVVVNKEFSSTLKYFDRLSNFQYSILLYLVIRSVGFNSIICLINVRLILSYPGLVCFFKLLAIVKSVVKSMLLINNAFEALERGEKSMI